MDNLNSGKLLLFVSHVLICPPNSNLANSKEFYLVFLFRINRDPPVIGEKKRFQIRKDLSCVLLLHNRCRTVFKRCTETLNRILNFKFESFATTRRRKKFAQRLWLWICQSVPLKLWKDVFTCCEWIFSEASTRTKEKLQIHTEDKSWQA